MYGYRRTLRIREFYAVLAFLVGISIGFLLTARTRITLVAARFDNNENILVVPHGCGNFMVIKNGGGERGEVGQIQMEANLNSASYLGIKESGGNVGVGIDVVPVVDERHRHHHHHHQHHHVNEDVGDDGRNNLIFVGVMTAQKYLETRALAVHRTWAKFLSGRVVFFASATAEVPSELPVVRLPGVDDTYPPQKKSFLMLKYMYEHYGDRYEWFMRADDDVYVRGDRLEAFLRSINSSRPQFIGQAGMGNKEEFGQLNLEKDENFCMGGPGIVFSRETLRRVVPHVRHCLKNLYSTHEDVEIGRCVRTFAGIPCTWSYEMQSIFYHNSSGSEAFTGNLKQKEVHRAITMHPIKHHSHLYRLHNYVQSLGIHDLHQRTLEQYRDIRKMMEFLHWNTSILASMVTRQSIVAGHESDDDTAKRLMATSSELGKPPSLMKTFPTGDTEVNKWDFFTSVIFSHTNSNPRRKLEEPLKATLDDVVNEIMEMINKFSKQRGRVIDFKDILYGYTRLNHRYGVDYILDLLLVYKKYRGRKMTIPVRKHVYFQQAFTEMQVRETVTDPSTEVIHFVLPLSGRFNTFQRFMKNFEEVCLFAGETVSLTVVLFEYSNEETMTVVSIVEELQRRYLNNRLRVEVMKGNFSRGMALEKGAAGVSRDTLLFFIDVDILMTRETLQRIRLNTIKGQQVYFPIVFSQFDPNFYSLSTTDTKMNDSFRLDDDNGYWRQFGFGLVALYSEDLRKIGGFNVTIRGWGKEDVDLYDKVVTSNLTVFRAVDPGLVHVFHSVECDPTLPTTQLEMCYGSRDNSYASVYKLARIVYGNPKVLEYARATRKQTVAKDAKNENT